MQKLTQDRWHADIKPENIIEVGDKYKLADPGYAWFRKMEADDNGVKPLASLRGGTDTYGAPEVYRMYAHQTVDIWSLGCVFSMAATWIVLGFPGVNQYGSLRAKGIASILKSAGDARRILLESQRLSAEPESIDCFHNGTKVLAEVTAWHGLLKNACRKHDTITAKVIDLIDQRMLLQDPEHRISARELRGKLKELLAPAKEALDESTNSETPEARTQRTRMERLLREIDQETGQNVGQDVEQLLPSPARSVMTGQPADRGLLKAQISHSLRRKVSHLFEPLPEPHGRRMSSELLVTYPAAVPVESRRTIETINVPKVQPLPSVSELAEMHMDGQNSPVGRSPRHSVNSRTGRRNTGMSLPPNRPAGHGVQNYENIIQAREKIERGKKIRKSSFGGFKIPKKMPAKDDFLGRYFQNRDIVSFHRVSTLSKANHPSRCSLSTMRSP
jgi:serine/threonine protein kinase